MCDVHDGEEVASADRKLPPSVSFDLQSAPTKNGIETNVI